MSFAYALYLRHKQQRRALQKLDGSGSCNFLTDSCIFPTKEIKGAQKYKFAHKLAHVGFFQNKILYFWKKNFLTGQNLGGGAIAPLPRR